MSLDPAEVKDIAHLARLAVSDDELASYARELSAILALVEEMQSVDTRAVTPMAHPLDMHQRLRPDQVTETDQHEHYQNNAPRTEAGLYLVPKVIE